MSSRQNFDFLDRLIYKIINIKQTKKYNVGQPILGKFQKLCQIVLFIKNSKNHLRNKLFRNTCI